MRHTQRFSLWMVAILLPFTASTNVAADVQRFDIELGGDYTYLPSPLGPGIPGCSPSELECGFGIQGSFSIEYDAATARLLNVDLILLGNDEIQNNPPIFAPVTADRVAQWLEDRRFVAIPSVPVYAAYADETHPELILTFAGQILLQGGYNATFVDGDGMQFDFTARVVVPEPGSAALVGGVLCLMLAVGGRWARSGGSANAKLRS